MSELALKRAVVVTSDRSDARAEMLLLFVVVSRSYHGEVVVLQQNWPAYVHSRGARVERAQSRYCVPEAGSDRHQRPDP